MSGTPTRPSRAKVALSFTVGGLLGLLLSFPALRPTARRLLGDPSMGTSAIVIGGSALGLAVVVIGLLTLFRSTI